MTGRLIRVLADWCPPFPAITSTIRAAASTRRPSRCWSRRSASSGIGVACPFDGEAQASVRQRSPPGAAPGRGSPAAGRRWPAPSRAAPAGSAGGPAPGCRSSVVTAGVNDGRAEALAAPSARTAPPNAATPSTPPMAPWKNHWARMVPAGTGGGTPPVIRSHAGTIASADGMVTAATARSGRHPPAAQQEGEHAPRAAGEREQQVAQPGQLAAAGEPVIGQREQAQEQQRAAGELGGPGRSPSRTALSTMPVTMTQAGGNTVACARGARAKAE